MIEYKTITCEVNKVPQEGNYHVINSKGDQYWFVNGKLHRDNDKPAIIHKNGTQEWCQYWYQNGLKHRDNDKPAVIEADGTQRWYQNGLKHRDNDLPAVIWDDGSKSWYQNNLKYRINNPAVIWDNGNVEYWYKDKQYSKQEYFDLLLSKGLITEKEYFAKIL